MDMLSNIRIVLLRPVSGSVFAGVFVSTLARDPGRFASSATFDAVMILILVANALMLYNAYRTAASLKAFLIGWSLLELASLALFLVMIIIDFFARFSSTEVWLLVVFCIDAEI